MELHVSAAVLTAGNLQGRDELSSSDAHRLCKARLCSSAALHKLVSDKYVPRSLCM